MERFVIQLNLQERGQVLTERRVRLTEAEANRIYNLLEVQLLTEAKAVSDDNLRQLTGLSTIDSRMARIHGSSESPALVASVSPSAAEGLKRRGLTAEDVLNHLKTNPPAPARPAPLTPEWGERLWPVINRRRGELIDKSFLTTLTAEETDELAMLQAYAEAYVAPFYDGPLKVLKALEAALHLKTDSQEKE